MVQYLFGLGQLQFLDPPLTCDWKGYQFEPDETPHYISDSEWFIFVGLTFVDYGYFYDRDNRWYYVTPFPFRIKMPLELVSHNLDESGNEFDYIRQVRRKVAEKILEKCRTDPEIRERLKDTPYTTDNALDAVVEELQPTPMCDSNDSLKRLWDNHKLIYNAFDDWVLVRADEEMRDIKEIVLRPKTEHHTETIDW